MSDVRTQFLHLNAADLNELAYGDASLELQAWAELHTAQCERCRELLTYAERLAGDCDAAADGLIAELAAETGAALEVGGSSYRIRHHDGGHRLPVINGLTAPDLEELLATTSKESLWILTWGGNTIVVATSSLISAQDVNRVVLAAAEDEDRDTLFLRLSAATHKGSFDLLYDGADRVFVRIEQ